MKIVLSVHEAATILERHLKDTSRINEDAEVDWTLSKTESYTMADVFNNQDLITFKFTVQDDDL